MLQHVLIAMAALFLSCCAHAEEASTSPNAPDQSLVQVINENKFLVNFDGETFTGAGWERLVQEGKAADFFLVGEEHGISENPKMIAQLFEALAPSGYSQLGIEISPFMAHRLDEAAQSAGIDGLEQLFSEPSGEPAFFGMREEAEMLADIRAILPDENQVFRGLDYEVIGDRQMIAALELMPKPVQAHVALEAFKSAVDTAWQEYEETRNPQYIFSFSGDPALVRTLTEAWPNRPATADQILHTLEETLEINRLFVSGENWESNYRRANLIRHNFVEYVNASTAEDQSSSPRMLIKMGASHLIRGRNSNGVFDLGTLVPELAEVRNRKSFSLLVLPGPEAQIAVLDPTRLEYASALPRNGYSNGLRLITDEASEQAFTLFDLRQLRAEIRTSDAAVSAQLRDIVFGYDMIIIMTGSMPSQNL